MTIETNPVRWVDVLAGSHDRICDLVSELDAESLQRPSRCSDWTIAQVLSHLGSGAELFKAMLDAVVAGEPAPDRDFMPPVWERWNALGPEEQAEAFLSTDGQLVEALEDLGDRLDELTFTFFGVMQLDAVGFVGMRLSEHALHTWDVAAALDPAATVDPDAVSLLVDRFPQMAQRAGSTERAAGGLAVRVVTSAPERRFVLTVERGVHLAPETPETPGAGAEPAGSAGGEEARAGGASEPEGGMPVLRLPAEAFLRLVAGRLDRAHAPSFDPATERLVDTLRAVFPGF